MQAKDVIRQIVELSHMVVRAYVEDLSDEDLLVRPVPAANHTAWQLGHVISGTAQMLEALGHKAPRLPDGFAAAYTKDTAGSNDPAAFAKKAEYLSLVETVKTATLAAIEATPDSALDAPGPEPMRHYAPTIASVLTLAGEHWLMHAGQVAVVRRKLGKPVLF